jgi:hypothetical protein
LKIHLENEGKFVDDHQTGTLLTSLDVPDMRPVDADKFGEGFLGQVAILAQLAHAVTERAQDCLIFQELDHPW